MKVRTLLSVFALLACASLFSQPVVAQQASPGPTLSKIAASGLIYLAAREAAVPFSYILADRETPAGYSWDICQRVVKAVETRIGKTVKVVPVVASSTGRLMLVKLGIADIECGVTVNTLGHQHQVAFSNSIYVSEIGVMVRADSGLKLGDDLSGKRVVTTAGTNGERLVRQLAIQRNMPVSYVFGLNDLEAMNLLERGDADAFVNEVAVLLSARANAKNPDAYVLLPRIISLLEPYGLVIRNDDPEFKKLVDEVLLQLFKSGEIEQIYDRWFNQPIPPEQHVLKLPLSDINKANFANPNDKPAN
jgi:glutamate/aspartate transport system substrate-binding protein